jgi:hypothetical protein
MVLDFETHSRNVVESVTLDGSEIGLERSVLELKVQGIKDGGRLVLLWLRLIFLSSRTLEALCFLFLAIFFESDVS